MRLLSICALATLAACGSGEQANVANESNIAEVPGPAGNSDAGGETSAAESEPLPDRPEIGGPQQWFERTRQGEAWAGYGPPYSETVFSVRCKVEAGRLIFSTTAVPDSGPGATTMHLSAPGVDQRLQAQVSEEGIPSTEAQVAADAEWVGRLARASGELIVRVGDSERVTVPIGRPLTSLLSDCRR